MEFRIRLREQQAPLVFVFAIKTGCIMRNNTFKEEIKMAVWELALLIYAMTVMTVNVVYLVVTVGVYNKMKPMFTKSMKFMEKMMEQAEKTFEDDEL